jgi:opacity protein-like surface antigen
MKKLFCIAVSVLAGATAAEASTGFFVTAAGGQSRIHTKYTSRYTDATRSAIPNSEVNAHDLYWSVGGGVSFTDYLRVAAGYEDWGKTTGPSTTPSGEIYPLTVGAKGMYVSYAPLFRIIPLISVDPEIGFLYSDIHIGTNFSSTSGMSDSNTKSGYKTCLRAGIGVSVHLPGSFAIGIKYLQIELPDTDSKVGSTFFTDKIRPRTIVLSALYTF